MPVYLGPGVYKGVQAGKKVYEKIASDSGSDSKDKITRRKWMGNIARSATIPIVAGIYAYGIRALFSPNELQAYFQTGLKHDLDLPLINAQKKNFINISGMMDKKHFEQFSGKGFIFEQK